MELFLTCTDVGKFKNTAEKDYAKFLKIKPGNIGRFTSWKERNILFHRKFFALIQYAIYHLPEDDFYDKWRNEKSMRTEIMFQNGRFDIHETIGGKKSYVPRSISFKSMDNEEFEKIYKEAFDTIMKHFLKGISLEEFQNGLAGFL